MIFRYPNDQQDEQTYGLLGQYTKMISIHIKLYFSLVYPPSYFSRNYDLVTH